MAGAQGVELRAPLQTSDHLKTVISKIRQHCPSLVDDRMVSEDITNIANLVHESDELCALGDGLVALGLGT